MELRKQATVKWLRLDEVPLRLGCAWLRLGALKCRRLWLLIGKRNLNGFSPDLRSKHLADSSSVMSDRTLQLPGKSSLISGFWTPAGFFGSHSNTRGVLLGPPFTSTLVGNNQQNLYRETTIGMILQSISLRLLNIIL